MTPFIRRDSLYHKSHKVAAIPSLIMQSERKLPHNLTRWKGTCLPLSCVLKLTQENSIPLSFTGSGPQLSHIWKFPRQGQPLNPLCWWLSHSRWFILGLHIWSDSGDLMVMAVPLFVWEAETNSSPRRMPISKSLFPGSQFSSVQSLSCVWLFVTPWTAALQVSLPTTNSQSVPKPMSIESVMPSNHLILLSPSPPALNLSQHQGLFQWVSSSHLEKAMATHSSTLAWTIWRTEEPGRLQSMGSWSVHQARAL